MNNKKIIIGFISIFLLCFFIFLFIKINNIKISDKQYNMNLLSNEISDDNNILINETTNENEIIVSYSPKEITKEDNIKTAEYNLAYILNHDEENYMDAVSNNEEIIKSKAPSNNGLWIAEDSRDEFISFLNTKINNRI